MRSNKITAMGYVALIYIILAVCFDFYYDLNDDVLLKDIVSGAYSGTPDAHSIQMLYPVSFLISLLYRLIPQLPWQGIFLCGTQMLCLYLITERMLSLLQDMGKARLRKIVFLLTEAVVLFVLCAWELVIIQYTITAAFAAACACFLVFTQEADNKERDISDKEQKNVSENETIRRFLRQNKTAIIFVILAYNIRSEMLLLLSPFIAATGILKWSQERQIFAKETMKKYVSLIGMILLGMGISMLVDFAAYSGSDWREFRDFFNARTRVYDYTWYPEYENAEHFYQSIGATPAKVALIDNYNFGLDDSIDAQLLWEIAEYAEKTGVKTPFLQKLKEAVTEYQWRTFHAQDAPYNYFVLAGYGMVLVFAVLLRDTSAIWKLPLMCIFRTIPWMYVILAKRVPARISHPLYYIEFLILCAWIFLYARNYRQTERTKCRWQRMCSVFCMGMLTVLAALQLPKMWMSLDTEMGRRTSVNAVMQEFDAYAKAHPENYYYLDVYSTVDFSEKMFQNVKNDQKNYDILGGWASGSPLQKQATESYYKDRLSRAELLLQENFYFVAEETVDTDFITEFYAAFGMDRKAEAVDKVAGADTTFIVYQLSQNNGLNGEVS